MMIVNGEVEFAPVYLNSVTKRVINRRFRLESSFQQIFYMIDVLINNRSCWNVELIKSQYINISTYRPIFESSYINLPVELSSPKKGVINIEKKDQKCFFWCHVRHIILSKKHPEIIKKMIKKVVQKLNFDVIEFPVQ